MLLIKFIVKCHLGRTLQWFQIFFTCEEDPCSSNSWAIGYSYDKILSNTPLLKIIAPNFFKMWKNNNRAFECPVHVPNGTEIIDKVSDTYKGLSKLWADMYVVDAQADLCVW